MYPTKKTLSASTFRAYEARQQARDARRQLRQSARVFAVSPLGLAAGGLAGFITGRSLAKAERRPSSKTLTQRLRTVLTFASLFRLF